jgi:hypothetical protein
MPATLSILMGVDEYQEALAAYFREDVSRHLEERVGSLAILGHRVAARLREADALVEEYAANGR